MNNFEEPLNIAIQQTIVPDYRMGLFRLLREEWGAQFQVYAGDYDFNGSPVSCEEAWSFFMRVRNVYLFGGKLLWQRDSFTQLVRSDVAILNANMRIVSNWVILFLRFLLGRPTILWGHAEGQSGVAARFRWCFLRLSSGFVAYTKSQAKMLGVRYPWLPAWVAANSCVSASDCAVMDSDCQQLDSILYVGRLVPKKKVSLLLDGFVVARERGLIAESTRLLYVGDGEDRERLEKRVAEAGLEHRVHFAGHVSDINELRTYYARAICSVSPGYVGLSATQSFSFGVPMLIARDEFHSPEIEACRDGFNAYFFDSDDPGELADMLSHIEQNEQVGSSKRSEIAEWTKQNYSFEAMRDAFIHTVREVAK